MDDLGVDARLVTGLADEPADIHQKSPDWFSARVADADARADARLGVF